ncbi:MAG: hypothetical protein ACXVYM_07015 [Gaiellaceae bacterium]
MFVACGLACGSGLIHADAAVQHFDQYVLFSVFFAVLASLQLAWAAAVYRSPGRALLRAGAVGSLLVAALWLMSRTSGLPLGPGRWAPEPVGAFDSIATADEIVLALLVFAPGGLGAGRVLRWLSREGALATGLLLILLSSLALVSGGHAH